jgi:hypothetical protein
VWRKGQCPNQREQYGDTVRLFIGTGHSPCKITLMPFTFVNNSMVILRGLIWFFIFKLVSFPAVLPKLFYTQLRPCVNLRVPCASPYRGSDPNFRRYLLTYFTPKNIVKSCFWGPSEAEGPQHRQSRVTEWVGCLPWLWVLSVCGEGEGSWVYL